MGENGNSKLLYDNLINSKRATVKEIGDFDTFNGLMKDSTNAVNLYSKLTTEKIASVDEIGDQNTFMGLMGFGEGENKAETKEAPRERGGFWDSYFGDVTERIGSGFIDIPLRIKKLQEVPVRMYANTIANNQGLTPAQKKAFAESLVSVTGNLPSSAINNETKKALTEASEELKSKSDRYAGKDFSQLWSDGDKTAALGEIFLTASESLPTSLMAMFGGAGGLALIGATTGAEKFTELDDIAGKDISISPTTEQEKANNADIVSKMNMNEFQKLTNATLTGVSEALTEKLGSVPIGKWLKGLYGKAGGKVASNVIEEGIGGWVKQVFDKYGLLIAPVSEGLEEFVNQIAENVTDWATGAREDLAPLEGADKAFVYGTGGGTQFSLAAAPGVAYNKYAELRGRKKEQKAIDENFEKLKNKDGNLHTAVDKDGNPITIQDETEGGMASITDINGEQKQINANEIEGRQIAPKDQVIGAQLLDYEQKKEVEKQQIAAEETADDVPDTFVYDEVEYKIQPNVLNDDGDPMAVAIDENGEPTGQTLPITEEVSQGIVTQLEQAPDKVPEIRTIKDGKQEYQIKPVEDGAYYVGVKIYNNETDADKAKRGIEKIIGNKNNVEIIPQDSGDPLVADNFQLKITPKQELTPEMQAEVDAQLATTYKIDGEQVDRDTVDEMIENADSIEELVGLEYQNDQEVSDMIAKKFPEEKTSYKINGEEVSPEKAKARIRFAKTKEKLSELEVVKDPEIEKLLQEKYDSFKEAENQLSDEDKNNNRLVNLVRSHNESSVAQRKRINTDVITTLAEELGYDIKKEKGIFVVTDQGNEISPKSVKLTKGVKDEPVKVDKTERQSDILPDKTDGGEEVLLRGDEITTEVKGGDSDISKLKPFDNFRESLGVKQDISKEVEQGFKGKVEGADVILTPNKDGSVQLESIVVSKDKRKQGVASKAMQSIIEKADEQGVDIKLKAIPESETDISQDQLVNFYKRYGFEFEGTEGVRKTQQQNGKSRTREELYRKDEGRTERKSGEYAQGTESVEPGVQREARNEVDNTEGRGASGSGDGGDRGNSGGESGERGSGRDVDSKKAINLDKRKKRQGLNGKRLEASLLDVTGDPYDIALMYFINGGKINKRALGDIFNKTDKRAISSEGQKRWSYRDYKAGLSTGQIAEKLAGQWSDIESDDAVWKTHVEEIIQKYHSPITMADALLAKYNKGTQDETDRQLASMKFDDEKNLVEEQHAEGLGFEQKLSDLYDMLIADENWPDDVQIEFNDLNNDQIAELLQMPENIAIFEVPVDVIIEKILKYERPTDSNLRSGQKDSGTSEGGKGKTETVSEPKPTKDNSRTEGEATPLTSEQQKISAEYDQRISDLKAQLKTEQKERSTKLASIDKRNGLFGDTKKEDNNLFDSEFDTSGDNVDAILQPYDAKILDTEKQITTLLKQKQQAVDALSDQGALEFDGESKVKPLEQAEKDVDPNPSDAQIEAGNAKKGHTRVQGFEIAIENAKGSTRSGTDDKGEAWSVKMANTYGYIKRTEASDGDQIDVFIGDNPDNGNIYVVDQINPDTKEFDEVKVMLGFNSISDAKKAYLNNYSKGWEGLGKITYSPTEKFKEWLGTGTRKLKAYSEYKVVKEEPKTIAEAQTVEELQELLGNGIVKKDKAYDLRMQELRKSDKGILFSAVELETRNELQDRLESEYPGLKLFLGGKGDIIKLSEITLPKEQRGQGIGTEIMNKIIDYADNNGMTISLTPSTDFGATSVNRLKSFYKEFGFVENKGRNKDFTISDSMIRASKNDIRFKVEEQSEIIQDAINYPSFEEFVDAYLNSNFRDSHSAPGNSKSELSIKERMEEGDDFNLLEVSQGFSTQPNDYFDPRNGARWYGYDDIEGMQSYRAIQSVMRDVNLQIENAEKVSKIPEIKAYRAIPKDIPENKFIDGDWVTFSKEYAKGHGEHRFGEGEYNIISQNIPADEVWWDGNDINEWGYDTGNTETLGRTDLKTIWESVHGKTRFKVEDVKTPIYLGKKPSDFKTFDEYSKEKDNADLEGLKTFSKTMGEQLGVEVIVVKTKDELPADIKRALSKKGINVYGAYKDGKTYVVSNTIAGRTNIAKRTILHETVGHKGFRILFPDVDERNNVLNLILEGMPQAEREQYTKNNGGNEGIAAEEYIADIAGNGKNPNLLNRIIAKIRAALRRLFPNLSFNKSEILAMLKRSKDALKKENLAERSEDARFKVIGEKGARSLDKAEEATIRLDNLNVAKEMEIAKKDAKTIKLSTGWERGADGKWRYEILDGEVRKDVLRELRTNERLANQTVLFENVTYAKNDEGRYDISMRKKGADNTLDFVHYSNLREVELKSIIDNKSVFDKIIKGEGEESLIGGDLRDAKSIDMDFETFITGGDILENVYVSPELYKAYPKLKDVIVRFVSKMGNGASFGIDNDGQPIISVGNPSYKIKEVIAHEVQHAIQNIEGFASGGNIKMFYRGSRKEETKRAFGKYQRLAGEVESRNVQSRLDMTPEQRRESLLKETEDVARKDQIFLYNAVEARLEDQNLTSEQKITNFGNESKRYDLEKSALSPTTLAESELYRHSERRGISDTDGFEKWQEEQYPIYVEKIQELNKKQYQDKKYLSEEEVDDLAFVYFELQEAEYNDISQDDLDMAMNTIATRRISDDFFSTDRKKEIKQVAKLAARNSFSEPEGKYGEDQTNIPNPDIRFSVEQAQKGQKQIVTLGEKIREAIQDNKLALKKWLAEVREMGIRVQDFENAYQKENLYHGKVLTKMDRFTEKQGKDVVNTVADFTKNTNLEVRDAQQYMIASHGIERNEYFWSKFPEKVGEDFSGLTELKEEVYKQIFETDKEEATKILQMPLSDFAEYYSNKIEETVGKGKIERLWKAINNATDFTLREWRDAGFISKEQYSELKDRYKRYIPLRGWDITDEFDYSTSIGGFSSPVILAKGRKSLADDPISYIFNMANSAVISGERNKIKQAMGYLVGNNKGALKDQVQFNKTYYVTTDEYENGERVVYETIERPDQELFDQGKVTMKQPTEYKQRKTSAQAKESEVEYYNDGNKYVLVFSGDPSVPRALNNKEQSKLIQSSNEAVSASIGKATRYLSSILTSLNPAFAIPNMTRDIPLAIISEWVEGDAKDAGTMFINLKRSEGAVRRALQGKPDLNNPIDVHYQNFLTNGGATGFVHLKSVEDFKKELLRDIKNINKSNSPSVLMGNGFRTGLRYIEQLSEWSENISRFAVYLNNINNGKTPEQSASAAKQSTVNFNTKGRLSPTLNGLFMFFNAGVQAVDKYFKMWGKSWPKMASVHAVLPLMGFLSALLLDLFGGEDDDDLRRYDKVSDYVKRNYMTLPLPYEDRVVSIPMPHVLRKFYGMGIDAYDLMTDRKTAGNVLMSQFSSIPQDILPIDPGGFLTKDGDITIKPFTPSVIKPFVELMLNENFMGAPIVPEPFTLEQMATIADTKRKRKSTNDAAVWITENLYKMGGGDETGLKYIYKNGELTKVPALFDISPAAIEYLAESYTGGVGRFFNDLYKTSSNIYSAGKKYLEDGEIKPALEEIDLNMVPVFNRFVRQAWGDPLKQKYYDTQRDIKRKIGIMKQAELSGDWDKYRSMMSELGLDASAYKLYDGIIDGVNDRYFQAQQADDKQLMENLDKQSREYMKDYLKMVNKKINRDGKD